MWWTGVKGAGASFIYSGQLHKTTISQGGRGAVGEGGGKEGWVFCLFLPAKGRG